jgi:TolA-binding protein
MTEKNPTLKNVIKTVEDLASSTVAGFALMEKRFVSLDIKLSKKIEDEVGSVRTELSKKIEDEVRSVKSEISLGIRELKEEIERLDIRIDRLFKQTHEDINVLIEEQEKIKLRLKKLELKNS